MGSKLRRTEKKRKKKQEKEDKDGEKRQRWRYWFVEQTLDLDSPCCSGTKTAGDTHSCAQTETRSTVTFIQRDLDVDTDSHLNTTLNVLNTKKKCQLNTSNFYHQHTFKHQTLTGHTFYLDFNCKYIHFILVFLGKCSDSFFNPFSLLT